MSFLPVIEYLAGIGVFGFVYWVLDNIVDEFLAVGVHRTGDVHDLLFYLWLGILVIYLVFGGLWVIREYNKPQRGDIL